jgi:CubicO group peptidase (beta-lactamase class C family)
MRVAPLQAATVTWSNSSGGDWNDASNWNSGAGPVPGASDDAVITIAGTYTVRVQGSGLVNALTLGGGGSAPTLRVEGNGSYGLGFVTETHHGHRSFGHSGGAPGMGTNLLIVPDLGYVAVLLTNYDPPLMRAVDELVREMITSR